MSSTRRQRASDRAERLAEAQGAADTLDEQGQTVDRQLGFVNRLLVGWRKVHETNHLARLFREEGHLG